MAALAVAVLLIVPVGYAAAPIPAFATAAQPGTATPHPQTIVVTPPLGGSVRYVQSSGSVGCAFEQTSVPLSFNHRSGEIGAAINSSAWSCAGPGGSTLGGTSYVVTQLVSKVPLPAPSSGRHRLEFYIWWHGSPSSQGINVSGVCPTITHHYRWGNSTTGQCIASASLNAWGHDFILDETNGTVVATFNHPTPPVTIRDDVSIDWGCANAAHGGACYSFNATHASRVANLSGNYTGPEAYFPVGTFNASHSYVWLFHGYLSVSTEVEGWTGASAYASWDLATHGNGLTLVSITIH